MNAPIDPQTTWDREDALYRLRRLQHLRMQLAEAEQQRDAARFALAKAVAEEKRLRAQLYAALEVETTPDLFTARPQEEPDPAIRCSYHDLHDRAADAEEETMPTGPPESYACPEWMTQHVIDDASIVGRFGHKPLKKPLGIKPIHWDGQLWVCTGGVYNGGRGTWDRYDLRLLIPAAEFEERYVSIPTKFQPELPADPTDEDRRQLYTGVVVKVGRKEFAIAPAGEGRTVVRRKEPS